MRKSNMSHRPTAAAISDRYRLENAHRCYLKRSSLVFFSILPRTQGQIVDKSLGSLGEQDGRLSADHLTSKTKENARAYLHLFIGFHDFLDASQRQTLALEVVLVCQLLCD